MIMARILCLHLALLFVLLSHTISAQAAVLNIMITLPFNIFFEFGNTISYLIANRAEILKDVDPSGNHTFYFEYMPTDPPWVIPTSFQSTVRRKNILGVIGDHFPDNTKRNTLAGAYNYTWTCAGALDVTELSYEQDSFPYFFSSYHKDAQRTFAFTKLMLIMGWKSMSIVGPEVDRHLFNSMEEYAQSVGITVAAKIMYPLLETIEEYHKTLTSIYDAGSQIVVFTRWNVDYLNLTREARARGMVNDEWVWIAPPDLQDALDTAFEPVDVSQLDGYITFKWREESYNAKYNESVTRYETAYPFSPPIPRYSFYFADCVTAIAKGLIRIANDVGVTNLLTRNYYPDRKKYFLHSFEGFTGTVAFDDKGNRIGDFEVYNWYSGNATKTFEVYANGTIVRLAPTYFASGGTTIPPDQVTRRNLIPRWTNSAGHTLAAFNIVFIVVMIMTWTYLFTVRNRAVVRNLSFPFLSLMSFGCILVLGSNLISLGDPSFASCQGSLWLFSLGFELVCVSSAIKAYRIYILFNDPFKARGKVTAKMAIIQISSILLCQIIILAIWTSVAPQKISRFINHFIRYEQCILFDSAQSTALMATNMVYNGLLLIALMVFAFLTRHVAGNFRETTWMLHVAQATLLIGIVVLTLSSIDFGESTLDVSIIKHCCILLADGLVYVSLVGRVAYAAYCSANSENNKVSEISSNTDSNQKKLKLSGKKGNAEGIDSDIGKHSSQATTLTSNPNRTLQQSQTKHHGNVLIGEFPFKPLSKLKSSWCIHQAVINHTLGIFYLVPKEPNGIQGWSSWLSQVQVTESVLELCSQVSLQGQAWDVQFPSEEERTLWQAAFAKGLKRGDLNKKKEKRKLLGS